MKVLITSVPAGSGHVRAAEAILAAFQRNAPDVEAEHIQVTDLVASGFRRIYVDGYRVTVNRAPALWGSIYRYWDKPQTGGLTPLLYQAQRYCSSGFYDYVNRFRPDVILSTHFLIPQLLAANPLQSCKPVLETVITDFDVHRFWVSDAASRYYVAHEDTAQALSRYGISPERIVASGIPVHPFFSDAVSPSAVFNRLNLDPQRKVILVLTGGLGLQALKDAVEKLFTISGGAQIITVSGRNDLLRAQLESLHPPKDVKLLNLGYVNNMHELLTISDLVITKPGGLTLSECLAKKKLMILFSPIPGQEEKNAEFLSARKAAVWAKSLNDLPAIAEKLLTQRPVQGAILWHVEACSKPHAAYAVADCLTRPSATLSPRERGRGEAAGLAA